MKALARWRNPIVTALIGGEMSRREIHRAVRTGNVPADEAEVDQALIALVRSGDLYRPFHGRYALAENPLSIQETTRDE